MTGQQPGLAQEANYNLRQWDQQLPHQPAAPASSSSFEGHIGNLSRSAWGDEEAGGAYGPLFLPDQFANIEEDPSWWSPPDNAFLDASPELAADLDWTTTMDEDLQHALTSAAITAALTTLAAPELPVLAPDPAAPMIPPTADWCGYGVFDSNPHPTASGGGVGGVGGASTYPTPATTTSSSSTSAPSAYPGTSGRRRHVDPELLLKRQRNKVAAQKYRQKKLDRIAELELEVTDVKRERDELRIQLAKQEAETAALREMMKLANPGMLEEC
ncbi:hypothetical protein V2A60_007012 [Cordyceps javanica]|uniref:B-ZIP transcription factor IDI-4 n=1 Tax=Cordyceps javanica TaxID=43265 RepID=A0A545US75_9HYPO|nr:b-ZIP transcription factor IDI-4 [Cordyceps javanica]TQW04433.1 b-ZIP transcription factor IDI-4 [Cordyceps javanica]